MLKTGLIIGSFFSLLTIILGAFGAHALKYQFNEYSQSIYDKAVLYQMFHSLGILLISIIDNATETIDLSLSIWILCFGIVLFSGSLYVLAITQVKWLGAITPIGGVLFIIGWSIVLLKVISSNI